MSDRFSVGAPAHGEAQRCDPVFSDYEWLITPTLHAAIEAEVAERVGRDVAERRLARCLGELLQAYLDLPAENLTDMTFTEWLTALNVWLRWLSWLCTEPPELTMAMRARREWRKLEGQVYDGLGFLEARCLRARASELRRILGDSGEPL